MKKNTKDDFSWGALIAMIIIIALIEWIGDYCNKHHDEWEKERFEEFKQWEYEITHQSYWDKAVYH